jgi:DNA-3-methyladenine glycosylase I
MSSDVIIGHDGKPRCAWAGPGDTALGRYHDEVWGNRTHHEPALFEALTLGVFQVGLSWSVVFGKRDAFRKAFRGFDVAKVAGWPSGMSTGWSRTPRSSATEPRSRRRSKTPA